MKSKPMWKEGLFLLPQHFQQQDAYNEDLVDRRLATLGANLWGVSELQIDPDELARNVFRLRRCRAVMPDGTVIEIGQGYALESLAVTAPKDLKEGREIEVYLALPAAGLGGVSAAGDSQGARYVRFEQPISDLYRSAEEADLELVRPNVQLLFGNENRQNYVTFKLAQVRAGASGRLMLSDSYLPPALSFAATEPLMLRLKRLVGALGAKQKELVAKYGGRGVSMVEFGAADVATFWYLHTVNSALPVFMHYASGDVHPETLYLSLATLAGQLSSFEATTDPLQLPRFDFRDLASTFYPLFDRVFKLLETVVSSRYQSIPLEQKQPGLYVAKVDEEQLLRRYMLYLVAGGDVPDDLLREDVPRYVKIGSVDQIANIVQSALPGVAIQLDLAPPAAVPVRQHMVYMRLDKHGRYWDAVLQSNTVAIYQPIQPERVRLELLAVEQ